MPPQGLLREIGTCFLEEGVPYHREPEIPIKYNKRIRRIRQTSLSRVGLPLLLLLTALSFVVSVLLISLQYQQQRPFLFLDSHVHESEQFLTHFLHDNTATTLAIQDSNPIQDAASIMTIRTLLAQQIGLKVLAPQLQGRGGMKLYHWWLADGQPIFVSQPCSDGELYYSTRHGSLHALSTCQGTETPPMWDRMQHVVKQLGPVQEGIVSLDLYANQEQVYFSNLSSDTLTLPETLKGLLHGALEVQSNLWTPSYVERLVNDMSWVLVSFPHSTTSKHANIKSLCDEAADSGHECPKNDMDAMEEDYPIRCASINANDELSTIGQWRIPTFETVITRVDWPWALTLATVLVILKVTNIGSQVKRSHVPRTVLVYLLAVVAYKYMQPSTAGLFSPQPLSTTIIESFQAFAIVHPMSSPYIAWSHIATYWFEIAAWRSRTVRGTLFWYFMYELVASYVNEHFHVTEEDNAIRCTRVSFVHDMKQYAVDDVVRAYLLPPFFCYLYLLPKVLLQYLPFTN